MASAPTRIPFADTNLPADAEVVALVNAEVDDLEPLRSLPRLRELRLTWTNPHRRRIGLPMDLVPLAESRHLEVLRLPGFAVDDLTPLRGLPRLRELDVQATRVADLAPLRAAHQLRVLRLRASRVDDLRPLRELVGLVQLDVAHTPVRDVAPLSGLTGLRDLLLEGTAVEDLRPVSGLGRLTTLAVARTPVSSLAGWGT